MNTLDDHRDLAGPDWERGVLYDLYRAAFATPDREVAGVLVGRRDDATGSTAIDAVITATEGRQLGQASMFGHDAWDYVRRTIDRRHPGTSVLGWYVSRPGYGTEPTPADRYNHDTWFTGMDQVLLVLDSRTLRGGLYVERDHDLVCVHEGPIERRYLRPSASTGVPWAALGLLTLAGVLLGVLSGLLSVA